MKQPPAQESIASGSRWQTVLASLSLAAVAAHLALRFVVPGDATALGLAWADVPLVLALVGCGTPLVLGLAVKLARREFGSDLLAGISIVTAVILEEYLAGTLVVLMLSGGAALEAYAVRSASAVLAALARRMPSVAHRKQEGSLTEVALDAVAVGDTLVLLPHEVCPVDGTVIDGHGVMDESYLTGEPYLMSKVAGTSVLSGAVNGETALTIRADRPAADSRYAKIMQVMRASEQSRPRLRRLGDQLGALYTPVAVAIALAAGIASWDATRFLAVLVVATPCPLLIAIPVAIIGAISLSARRGVIIKDPAILEKVGACRTAIFDKTGTLTYGRPELTQIATALDWPSGKLLLLVAALERYSKHPLAGAVLHAAHAAGLTLPEADGARELPGQGLIGSVCGRTVQITSRGKALAHAPDLQAQLPPPAAGLECVVLVDDAYAATLRFRDRPRPDGAPFIRHLAQRHGFTRVMLVSGDRESEVRYLAEQVGISEVHAGQTPEQKLTIVRAETSKANTIYVGDGINDAPAMTAATVGVAFGQDSDITAEAAGAVIMERSLKKVDEFLHIGARLRAIALQSAVGGMVLSLAGMMLAALGFLLPVPGAILQEIIDVLAVVNALRVAVPPRSLTDY
jgi:heavy metal translocating P-type ATPase